jgi:hypothetical protein
MRHDGGAGSSPDATRALPSDGLRSAVAAAFAASPSALLHHASFVGTWGLDVIVMIGRSIAGSA